MVYRDCLCVNTTNTVISHGTSTFEHLSIIISSNNRRINVIGIYCPPPSSDTLFYNQFSDVLDAADLLTEETLVCGDFNCPGDTPTTIDTRLDQLVTDHNFRQYVTESTRGHPGNILDLVIGRIGGVEVTNIRTTEVGFSDHKLVTFNIKFPITINTTKSFSFRDLKRIDLHKFSDQIRRSKIYTSPPSDVNEFVNELQSTVTAALDEQAPLKAFTKRVRRKTCAVWMSEEAKKAKATARKSERRFRRTQSEDDYVEYRRAHRLPSKAVGAARTSYLRDELKRAESTNSFRARWKSFNKLLHSDDRAAITHPRDASRLASSFTDFFTDKLLKIRSHIASQLPAVAAGSSFNVSINPSLSQPLCEFPRVTTAAVIQLLHSMPGKSSPLDFIPTFLLKSCAPVFSPILANLANLSFSTGTFPTQFKIAQVTPLLKKPNLDSNDPASYRPISNLNTIGKILERLALVTLRNHLTSSPNFNRFQSAYRPAHSTETAVLKIADDLYSNIDKGHASVLMTIDLSAAFDTVSHTILHHRLGEDFGVSGCVSQWIKCYLTDRSQFVKCGEVAGTTTAVVSGVPQGSVLGPLLFGAYVAPIGQIISHFEVGQQHYADDTTLYVRLGSSCTMPANLMDCVDALRKWFLINDMQVNPDKTEIMTVGSRGQLKRLDGAASVSVGGAQLGWSESVKIIGVTFDRSLNFEKHVAGVCQTSAYHTRALRHIRPYLSVTQAAQLGCAIVTSRLDYCNSALYGTSASNISRLQRVQNNLARVVCGASSRTSATPLLKKLHWLPVEHRIIHKVAVLTYNALHNDAPGYLRDIITEHKHNRSLRSTGTLTLDVPFVKTVAGEKAFRSAAPRVWNKLSPQTRSMTSVTSFKKHLKTELFTAAYLT